MIAAMGLPLVRWHDHYVAPPLDGRMVVRGDGEATVRSDQAGDPNTAEDEEQIMSLRPSVLEQLQRHMIWRHLHPDVYREDDVRSINHDAIYAALYCDHGEPDSERTLRRFLEDMSPFLSHTDRRWVTNYSRRPNDSAVV